MNHLYSARNSSLESADKYRSLIRNKLTWKQFQYWHFKKVYTGKSKLILSWIALEKEHLKNYHLNNDAIAKAHSVVEAS